MSDCTQRLCWIKAPISLQGHYRQESFQKGWNTASLRTFFLLPICCALPKTEDHVLLEATWSSGSLGSVLASGCSRGGKPHILPALLFRRWLPSKQWLSTASRRPEIHHPKIVRGEKAARAAWPRQHSSTHQTVVPAGSQLSQATMHHWPTPLLGPL